MAILGIETSCDETGVAVYDGQAGLLANLLYSQVDTHRLYGGVVPELASRDHGAKLMPLVGDALAEAGLRLGQLSAVAYTGGPGLVGALMVGATFSCSVAFGLSIPAIPIHHMEGHLLAPMLENDPPAFPFLALLVSGGHTQLVMVRGLGRYQTLGATLDDAAGEAFDKVAKLLGLPYPGGPQVARAATTGDPSAIRFPRPMLARDSLDFSFSGLKTAVRLSVEAHRGPDGRLHDGTLADIAASFQAAVVDTLIAKSLRALDTHNVSRLVVAGGVGANSALRRQLKAAAAVRGAQVYYPRPEYCTDNAAMIAYAGWCRRVETQAAPARIVATPRWALDDLSPPLAEQA
jgi:N6-L-threonylcarbamoyladenine synthase